MAQLMLGIDQSTQGTKVLLFDSAGRLYRRFSKNHRQLINDQGWVSHDLTEIWENVLSLVTQAQQLVSANGDEIVGIGITNQRESAAAWSRKDGSPLAKTVVWQCARATALCDQLVKRGVGAAVQAKSGMPLSPYFTAAKFAWLLQNEPAVKAAANQDELCLGTMDSWLIYQLTAGKSFKTEPSNACRTQLLNIETLNWDQELCDIFDVPMASLGTVVDSDALFGMTDVSGRLPHAVPIHGVLGDSQAALFGQHCVEFGDVKATYGTGSSIMMNIGKRPVRSKNGLMTSVGWRFKGEAAYVLEGNVNYSGAVVKWLQEDLDLIDDAAETGTLAMAANPQDQTCLVPAFSGLGAPYWNDKAQAVVWGMTRTTRKPEFVKAALNSIVFQINDVIQQMLGDIGCQQTVLKVDGGVTKNQYLMQFQADITDAKLLLPNFEELSGFGAVYAAGMALGLYTATTYQQDVSYQSYQPRMATEQRQADLKIWHRAVTIVNQNFS
ncbi:glycerol kinase [Lactiplantibacillus xiangfangensis]|uniref:ATP:glycerol 3-phosphotransferase n=1 Tax=Lactiplantibacillus xiangfangensis TaxID=942150 RepID=A0A0R2MTK8_9LACO|nr:glycerol kinase GlpK [Lactiplantibacillus xiangfangensis]KRO14026.1 glycerol kinase 1 [Lactiplantibacillus xiangfangensis]